LQVDFKKFFDDFLRVSGGPERKPYFVPFSRSESGSANFFNENVAGSYATSSLRPNSPFRQVVIITGQRSGTRYTLTPDHWELAFRHLAFSKRIPLVALSVYIYRDYAIEVNVGGFEDFTRSFAEEFGLQTEAAGRPWEDLFEVNAAYLSGVELSEPV
jgi:hypothetical protein